MEYNGRMSTRRPIVALTSTPYLPGYETIDQTIRTYCRYIGREANLGMGICPEGAEARKEFQGPKVPGPWTGSFAHAVCISAHPFPEDAPIVALHGDRFLLHGRIWVLTDDNPRTYPRLTLD